MLVKSRFRPAIRSPGLNPTKWCRVDLHDKGRYNRENGRNNFSRAISILEIRNFVEAESGGLECITGVSGWCAEENTKRRFRPRRESF